MGRDWQWLGIAALLLVLSACEVDKPADKESVSQPMIEQPVADTPQVTSPPATDLPLDLSPAAANGGDSASTDVTDISHEQGPSSDVDETRLLRIGTTINFAGGNQESLTLTWLEHVFAELGYQVQMEYVPGRRMIIELNRGIMDVDLVRAVDISRGFDNITRVDHPWINSCILAVGLQGQRQAFLDAATLEREQNVGVITGTPGLLALIAREWPAAKITEYKSDRQAALMLQHQRVDFIITPHVSWGGLSEASVRRLEVFDIVTEMEGYMHVHKSHAEMIPALIASMKKNAAESAAFSCSTERFRKRLALP